MQNGFSEQYALLGEWKAFVEIMVRHHKEDKKKCIHDVDGGCHWGKAKGAAFKFNLWRDVLKRISLHFSIFCWRVQACGGGNILIKVHCESLSHILQFCQKVLTLKLASIFIPSVTSKSFSIMKMLPTSQIIDSNYKIEIVIISLPTQTQSFR